MSGARQTDLVFVTRHTLEMHALDPFRDIRQSKGNNTVRDITKKNVPALQERVQLSRSELAQKTLCVQFKNERTKVTMSKVKGN